MVDNDEQRRRARAGTVQAPPRIAVAVRDVLARDGERAATERLHLSPETATRIAARLPVRRGSVLVAARALGMEVDDG
jgi:hypothetical protein